LFQFPIKAECRIVQKLKRVLKPSLAAPFTFVWSGSHPEPSRSEGMAARLLLRLVSVVWPAVDGK
jgi:hypothetical protein